MCDACQSFDLEHFVASGRGRVYSWTVVHNMGHPAFAPPYAVLLVEVEEGPRILAQLAAPDGDEWERLEVGMPVRMVFRRRAVDDKRGFIKYFWKATPDHTAEDAKGSEV